MLKFDEFVCKNNNSDETGTIPLSGTTIGREI